MGKINLNLEVTYLWGRSYLKYIDFLNQYISNLGQFILSMTFPIVQKKKLYIVCAPFIKNEILWLLLFLFYCFHHGFS